MSLTELEMFLRDERVGISVSGTGEFVLQGEYGRAYVGRTIEAVVTQWRQDNPPASVGPVAPTPDGIWVRLREAQKRDHAETVEGKVLGLPVKFIVGERLSFVDPRDVTELPEGFRVMDVDGAAVVVRSPPGPESDR